MDKKDKPAGAGFWGTPELLNRYSNDTPGQSKKVKLKKEDRNMKSAKEFLNDIIEEIVNEDLLNEENNPTDPAKWAASISAAKSKFDVYPSAYANAWASKHYKAAGGGWESTNEEVDLDEALKAAKNAGPFTVVAIKGGKVVDTFRDAAHNELKDVVAFVKSNNKGAKVSVEAKGGKIVHTESVDLGEAKKRITKLHGKYPKGTHYCATHVEHAEFGHGKPITSQHAAPDQLGNIEWYDVMFEHGIERGVATNEMEILLSEVHENHDHHDGVDIDEANMVKVEVDPKKKIGYEVKSVGPGGKTTVTKRKDMPDTEDVGEAFDSKKSAEEIRIRTKYRMSKDGGKDGKPYSPEDMHNAMDSLQRKKARTNRVRRLGSGHPSKKNLNLKIGEAAGQNPLKTTFGGIDKTKDTASYKKYLDDVAVAKAKRDAQIKKEREDGTRSRYESVERVDEGKWEAGDHEGSYDVRIKDKDKTVVFVDHEAGYSDGHAYVSVKKNGKKHSADNKVKHKDVDKLIKRYSTGTTATRHQVSHPNDGPSGWSESVEQVDEMNYLGKDKKFGRKFYEKGGQLHVVVNDGKPQNLGSVEVKGNAKMIRGLVKEDSIDLDEKLQIKLKSKFKPSSGGSDVNKIFDVIIDGVRVGIMTKETSDDHNYGDGGSYMSFKILKPGSRNKYAEHINVNDVEDPNDFFKQLKKDPRTAKRTIKAIKAHGVELTNLDSKHESVEFVESVNEESIDEAVFSKSQLDKLRAEYSKIKTVDPSQPTYGKLTAFLDKLDDAKLKQLSTAKIKFVSGLAHNRVTKRSMK